MARLFLIAALLFTISTPVAHAATWSSPVLIAPDFAGRAISCPTTTFCAAVDLFGRASTSSDGTSWTRPTARHGFGYRAISCPTTTFCQAVGSGHR